jgi:addiction module HigA family antidote
LTFAVRGITFPPVIRSFRNRALKRYFEAGDPSGLSVPNVARVGRMLRALEAATRPEQVNLPGFYWHPLQRRSALGDQGYRQLANHLRMGWRRCRRRQFGGLPLTIELRTGTGLPAMHPGELLREEILPALGRPRAEIAHLLGVSRQALHAILTERASVSPEMALRLGKLCGNGPELWLALQTRYDLERLRRDKAAEIEAIPTLQAA